MDKKSNKKRYGKDGRFTQKGKEYGALLLTLLLAAALALLANPGPGRWLASVLEPKSHPAEDISAEEAGGAENGEGLTIHYLDVEKCNCVLAESSDGHFMLIDAGSNGEEHTDKIIAYLEEKGVQTLDYLVITHPHRDHIAAVPAVISRFFVKEVLMGDFDTETVGTKTFERVSDAMAAGDLLITRPSPGDELKLGNASFRILINDDSLQTAMEDLNDCSMGLLLTDGFHRFLFYGDGEEKAEEALLSSGFDLRSDVLMAAHHGSNSSTKKEILSAVRPQIAVISCGIDGDGEVQKPSKKVLKRLEEAGVTVYRTDENGTIVITSKKDGLFVSVFSFAKVSDGSHGSETESITGGESHGLQRLQGSLPLSRAS